jgi:hypothetical protein
VIRPASLLRPAAHAAATLHGRGVVPPAGTATSPRREQGSDGSDTDSDDGWNQQMAADPWTVKK